MPCILKHKVMPLHLSGLDPVRSITSLRLDQSNDSTFTKLKLVLLQLDLAIPFPSQITLTGFATYIYTIPY